MQNETFINDKDIFLEFGASLIGASFENLLKRPDRKEVAENNMITHSGVQVFSDEVKMTEQEIELTFLLSGTTLEDYLDKLERLQDEIDNDAKGGNFTLKVLPLKKIFTLRRKTYTPIDTLKANTGKLSVTVRELDYTTRVKI